MKRALSAFIIILVFIIVPHNRAYAWPQQEKLTASDGDVFEEFGTSVSMSGNYVVVGAVRDDDSAYEAGSAYIFYYDVNEWIEQAKLLASDGAMYDDFGQSASIDGDFAVVAAPGDDTDSGSAYIFQRDETAWNELSKITASDAANYDHFGWSVSISGDYVIAGTYGDDDNDNESGSAYIFAPNALDSNDWDQIIKLYPSDTWADDYFGYSVAISGDYAIVGAYGEDEKANAAGAAYIFKRNENNWTQQDKLLASDGSSEDYFGYAVSINGDCALIGAVGDNSNAGSAYIFRRDDTDWIQQAKLTASDGAANDKFGTSVSIGDIYAVVGADGDDDNGSESGSAYLFKYDGADWNQILKLTAQDGSGEDFFGRTVSIDAQRVVIGALGDDDNGTKSGSAYIYDKGLCPTADLNDDCYIDFEDLAILTSQWLHGDK